MCSLRRAACLAVPPAVHPACHAPRLLCYTPRLLHTLPLSEAHQGGEEGQCHRGVPHDSVRLRWAVVVSSVRRGLPARKFAAPAHLQFDALPNHRPADPATGPPCAVVAAHGAGTLPRTRPAKPTPPFRCTATSGSRRTGASQKGRSSTSRRWCR